MNSKIILCIGFLVSLLLMCGCELPAEQTVSPEYLSVTGLLLTRSSESQIISVFKTSSIGDKNSKDNFISGAAVYVTDSLSYLSRYMLTDDLTYGKGYKSPEKTDFIPGRKYYLRVETVSANVFGETRFPDDFEITSHKDEDTVRVPEDIPQDFELRWTKSNGSYGYIVYVSSTTAIKRNDGTIENYGSGKTIATVENCCRISVYKSGYGMGKFIKSEELITIIAYDKNFRAHHYESQNSAGVKGAYGYFASAVSKTIRLIIK